MLCSAKCGFTTVPHLVVPCRRPLFFETPFCMVFWEGKITPKWCPKGRLKSLKIIKNRKRTVPKGHLNSIPQKTSKITDFGRVWDLPNRAETQARASFSLIRLGTKKCPKWPQKAPILEALGRLKSEKTWNSAPRKNGDFLGIKKHQNDLQNGGRKC